MSKKTTDQKSEKQTKVKKPVVLTEEELDGAQGALSQGGNERQKGIFAADYPDVEYSPRIKDGS